MTDGEPSDEEPTRPHRWVFVWGPAAGLLGLALLGLFGWYSTSAVAIHWIGGYPLNVHILPGDHPPQGVSRDAFYRPDDAALAVSD